MKSTLVSFFITLVIVLSSCDQGFSPDISIRLNPNEISPLTALLEIDSEQSYSLKVEVTGDIPVIRIYDGEAGKKEFPVMGLYPDQVNKLILTFVTEDGEKEKVIEVKTDPLPAGLPTIQINTLNRSKMEAGMHACDFHLANNGKFQSIPFAFDDRGVIRWFVDLRSANKMVAPLRRLRNGNFLACSRHTIYEFDLLGTMKKTSINNNYGIHHEALELPNGRLLLAVGKRDSRILLDGEEIWSDSDWIVLFDRENSRIIKEWDLAKHLDVSRDDLNFFGKGDWLHMNGFAFNPDDLSLIISNKNQGLAKLHLSDKLQWILSPKKNWEKAGRRGEGPDTKPYLLTAVDTNENPYLEEVQLGDKSAADFDFAWGNHAPLIMPNGNLMVFDNGAGRNFRNRASYSRAVEYEIDPTNMTVKQVWQYGKERGVELFSAIVSDVDYLADTGNILFTSGFLNPGRNTKGKIVEIDYSSKEVYFEATLNFKTLNGSGQMAWGQTDILYRSDRLELFQ